MKNASHPSGAEFQLDPDEPAMKPVPEKGAEVAKRDPSGGPTTLGWWLDDGPGSPIAADIKEPEKRL